MLRAVQGDELEVAARGPQAQELLAALGALAADNFGDAPDAGRRPRNSRPPRRRRPRGAPPARRRRAAGRTAGARAARRRAAGCARRRAPRRAASAAPPPAAPGAVLRGVTAVRGLAIGPARWSKLAEFDLDAVTAGPPEEEARRLSAAIDAAREQLAATAARLPAGEAEIFAAQTLLLADAALIEPAQAAVADGEPAARAFKQAADEVAAVFAGAEDAYLRARAIDVRDVADRVLDRARRRAGAEHRSSPASSSPTS